jgi:hypothetical protein
MNVRVAQTRAETARVIPSFPVLIIFVRYPPDERDACCPTSTIAVPAVRLTGRSARALPRHLAKHEGHVF